MNGATGLDGIGRHIRRLREARGWTRQNMAKRSGLAPDTIRRLEKEEFSPNLRTLKCVVSAFGISFSTLFSSFESEDAPALKELSALLTGRPAKEISTVMNLVRAFLRELDAYRSGRHE